MKRTLLTSLLLALSAVSALAGGWPAYRADAGRTGCTPEKLPAKLSLRWVHKPAHPPAPAWPGDERMAFDRAPHVVSDGKSVYFGSSADCKVYALDAATGKARWSFFTGGPVRFAPALWKDRLFVVSDDGYLYCLSGKGGKLIWKKRPSPSGRKVLGNGRMISKWPARGGPVVVGDVVYFGAGIWPTEGVYLCALKASDGRPVWINDKTGSLRMNQPHGARAKSGVSIQGYLAVSGDKLLTPAGRGPYACFDLEGGKLLYHHLGSGWSYGAFGPTVGGSGIVAAGTAVFHGSLWACTVENGKGHRFRDSGLRSATVAAGPKHIYFWNGKGITGIDRTKPFNVTTTGDKRKRKVDVLNEVWRADLAAGRKESLVVAGGKIMLGGVGEVGIVDIATKRQSWTAKVEGTAYGLAVAGGRLLVSTDQGHICCFGAGGGGAAVIAGKPAADPYPGNAAFAAAAEIVEKTGVTKGYCLDLGCGDGGLAYELARRTKLHIIGIEKDPAKVAAARRNLDAAGLYGARVTIFQGDPGKTEFPNCFADLVVSASGAVSETEALRCARPYGGIVCVGKPGAMKKSVRGPLKGAGSWTHQYADTGNTSCSGDELVKGPLSVLWFSDSDQKMPSRHGRAPAPLFANGIMLVQGLDDVRAFNAYNGRVVWKFPLAGIGKPWDHAHHVPGVAASGANVCTDGRSLYVARGDRCLRIDCRTGKKLGEFKTPSGKWGYISCRSGLLLGSVVEEGVRLRGKMPGYSKTLFALDATSGKLAWKYEAKRAIRHNAIAVGKDVVYLIDRPVAPVDVKAVKRGQKQPAHPTGSLLALELKTGRVKWETKENIYGTMLVLSAKQDTLLMSYQPGQYVNISSELGGRFATFQASDGKLRHEVAAKYSRRPTVIGSTVYSGPEAWDILTGKRKEGRSFRISYSCGALAAGKHMLAFRSGCLGYYDLRRKAGTESFGGIRPGCWLNAIPAGGLLLVPDYSAGCACSYQMKANVALEPGK